VADTEATHEDEELKLPTEAEIIYRMQQRQRKIVNWGRRVTYELVKTNIGLILENGLGNLAAKETADTVKSGAIAETVEAFKASLGGLEDVDNA